MIRYLSHNLIDKAKWDACIGISPNRRIYAYSWYLDIVCPRWGALVSGDYEGVFPLTGNRKWTINYLYQPYFTQQLGLFTSGVTDEQMLAEFLAAIPDKFRFAEIQLNERNRFNVTGWRWMERLNHELNLSPGYLEIVDQYAQNTRRNLKKARECGVTIGKLSSVDELITLFKVNYGAREGKLTSQNYVTIYKLLKYFMAHSMGYPLAVFDSSKKLSAAAFIVQDKARYYFLFAASSQEARENGAMFYLINHFIEKHAGLPVVLDFEGGNDPQLGRFYKSFGAVAMPYPAISMNRLPAVARYVLNFTRQISNREI